MSSPGGLCFPEPVAPTMPELRLSVAGRDLVGVSIGAIATAFAIPGLDAAVDMGRCSPLLAAQGTVLLSHCHSDHVAGLVAWLSAHTRRYPGHTTRIVLPGERREALLTALTAWPDLDGVRRRVRLEEVLVAAAPGDRVELAGGVAAASAFAGRHHTAALGWALTLAGASRPWAVLAGDSTVEPFAKRPELLDAAVAVVDCSFVEPGTRVAARLGGHGHLSDWLELAPRLACDTLVLAHLPPEPDLSRMAAAVAGLPRGLRVVAWVAPPSSGSPWAQRGLPETSTAVADAAGPRRESE